LDDGVVIAPGSIERVYRDGVLLLLPKVIPSIRKQSAFHDVMSVNSRLATIHTRVPVSSEYALAELVSG
jgi:hypothetical protein